MTKFGITFNGKHSYKDFGLRVLERKIGNPSKIKRKVKVPHSNEAFDFASIYGVQEYTESELTYIFQLKNTDKINLNVMETSITNWLMKASEKTKLTDDYIPNLYFMAEVEEAIDYDELQFSGEFSVTFICQSFEVDQPFKNEKELDFKIGLTQEERFGITFNGKHSFNDFGLRVLERTIGNPSKVMRKSRVPYSNEVYDFSTIYGDQEYTERELAYTFQLKNADKIDLNLMENQIKEWLITPNQKIKLEDDYVKGFYFLAEVEESIDYEELRFSGKFNVTFTCYPFKKDEYLEGADIWDDFNFELDTAQDVEYELDRLPFIPIKVGSMATITAWATNYLGGDPTLNGLNGKSYKVLDIQYEGSSSSNRSYKLEGLDHWVLEQDILECQGNGLEITLHNAGAVGLLPQITTSYPTSILFDGVAYNVEVGTSKGIRLNSGENKMKLYTHRPTTISFEFRKELI